MRCITVRLQVSSPERSSFSMAVSTLNRCFVIVVCIINIGVIIIVVGV